MFDTIRLYLEALFAVAMMGTAGAIAGFVAGAVSGDRTTVIGTAAAVFVLTGAVLAFRLWRTTRNPIVPPSPGI